VSALEVGAIGRAGADEANRLAWVDVAKGLCIVLVVMMHATLSTGVTLGGEGFLHTIVTFAKPFRMPDFFVLSGLFLGRVIDRDWRLFLDRRLVHFAYFYVLWVLIQSVVKYGQIVDGAGPMAFLSHLAMAVVEPYSTLWFIYVLAVFSVCTKLLRRVRRRCSSAWRSSWKAYRSTAAATWWTSSAPATSGSCWATSAPSAYSRSPTGCGAMPARP
jgi:uncharacterized membrane protein YcfT